MNRSMIEIDPTATKLRRVGRLSRRRMRVDGAVVANGLHTDGTLTVEISGLGSPVAGVPDLFEWEADRPVALVIIRSGIDGEDVSFQVGPRTHGIARTSGPSDGSGIRYVAFCYDAAPSPTAIAAVVSSEVLPEPVAVPAAAAVAVEPQPRRRIAAAWLAPTGRERRSVLDLILRGTAVRRAAI